MDPAINMEKERAVELADIITVKYSQDTIDAKRKEIAQLLMNKSFAVKSETISTISSGDLYLLFDLYDSVFLNNWFRDFYKDVINISFSKLLTKSAGITYCPNNKKSIEQSPAKYEIKIGINLIFNYNKMQGNKIVCGIETSNNLAALLLVFEHELCHVLENYVFGNTNCKKERFKTLSQNLFGHMESNHRLPTRESLIYQTLDLKKGDPVTFEYKGKTLDGIISRINKRATIMVKSKHGQYSDKAGNTYSKYYVPIALLNKNY